MVDRSKSGIPSISAILQNRGWVTVCKKFADTILGSINQLAEFPEMGAVKYDTLMGKHGFRALFMGNYVCVYRIEGDTVYVYHLADARKNYIYHIFGME